MLQLIGDEKMTNESPDFDDYGEPIYEDDEIIIKGSNARKVFKQVEEILDDTIHKERR